MENKIVNGRDLVPRGIYRQINSPKSKVNPILVIGRSSLGINLLPIKDGIDETWSLLPHGCKIGELGCACIEGVRLKSYSTAAGEQYEQIEILPQTYYTAIIHLISDFYTGMVVFNEEKKKWHYFNDTYLLDQKEVVKSKPTYKHIREFVNRFAKNDTTGYVFLENAFNLYSKYVSVIHEYNPTYDQESFENDIFEALTESRIKFCMDTIEKGRRIKWVKFYSNDIDIEVSKKTKIGWAHSIRTFANEMIEARYDSSIGEQELYDAYLVWAKQALRDGRITTYKQFTRLGDFSDIFMRFIVGDISEYALYKKDSKDKSLWRIGGIAFKNDPIESEEEPLKEENLSNDDLVLIPDTEGGMVYDLLPASTYTRTRVDGTVKKVERANKVTKTNRHLFSRAEVEVIAKSTNSAISSMFNVHISTASIMRKNAIKIVDDEEKLQKRVKTVDYFGLFDQGMMPADIVEQYKIPIHVVELRYDDYICSRLSGDTGNDEAVRRWDEYIQTMDAYGLAEMVDTSYKKLALDEGCNITTIGNIVRKVNQEVLYKNPLYLVGFGSMAFDPDDMVSYINECRDSNSIMDRIDVEIYDTISKLVVPYRKSYSDHAKIYSGAMDIPDYVPEELRTRFKNLIAHRFGSNVSIFIDNCDLVGDNVINNAATMMMRHTQYNSAKAQHRSRGNLAN